MLRSVFFRVSSCLSLGISCNIPARIGALTEPTSSQKDSVFQSYAILVFSSVIFSHALDVSCTNWRFDGTEEFPNRRCLFKTMQFSFFLVSFFRMPWTFPARIGALRNRIIPKKTVFFQNCAIPVFSNVIFRMPWTFPARIDALTESRNSPKDNVFFQNCAILVFSSVIFSHVLDVFGFVPESGTHFLLGI